jgi:hypothetical protein
LHEHAHAFLHTAKVGIKKLPKDWFHNLPENMNEPLTEFIAYSLIENDKPIWVKIFEIID